MPRICPERLLTTLEPLLERGTGAIKSELEVDKIYGLMSKFSKKLVSKCTYINILKSTRGEILDLFLQRGGWDMIHTWVADANENKHFDFLKDVFTLLVSAPATVERLRANELPKVIKTISRECENPEVRDLAKDVVNKWISVAKQQGTSNATATVPYVVTKVPVQSNSVTSSKPTAAAPEESDIPADMDISSLDLSSAMTHFNPEDFSKLVNDVDDQLGLSEAIAAGNAVAQSVDNFNVIIDGSDTVKIDLSAQGDSKAPKLTINAGDPAGTNAVNLVNVGAGPVNPEANPFCLIMKDGKHYLVRLKKVASNEDIADSPSQQEISSTSEVTGSSGKKHKPSILAKSKNAPAMVIPAIPQPPPDSLSKSKSAKSSRSKSSDSSSNCSSSSGAKKQRSSSKSSSAAAAKKADEEKRKEDHLRQKIKQEKANVKKRQKEAEAAKKQKEKDEKTLKELGLHREPSLTTPPKTKIQKKQASFEEMIGIPGTVENTKSLKKKSSTEPSGANEGNSQSSKSAYSSNSTRPGDKEKDKERKHRMKVYTSKKSRADDLLKDLTENAKSKPNKSDSSSSKTESSGLKTDKSLVGGNIAHKPEKRQSLENIEKPGDTKKAKLGEDTSDKKKEKQMLREKKPSNAGIKESSLFGDILTASDGQNLTVKKKRRQSSEKDNKDAQKSGRNASSLPSKEKPSTPIEPLLPAPAQPKFTFYRDTLDDDDDKPQKTAKTSISSPPLASAEEPMEVIIEDEEETPASPMDQDSPVGNDPSAPAVMKSALVILRSRNKPKKSVRWRDDDELVETRTFELDEDERVNVYRQTQNTFLTMMEREKQLEKEYINKRHGFLHYEDCEERMPWRTPPLLAQPQELPDVCSIEQSVQEERERNNLGLFLPPGSALPDTAAEPDPTSPDNDAEIRTIPMEDVVGITKVFNHEEKMWPRPKFGGQVDIIHSSSPSITHQPPGFGMSPFSVDMRVPPNGLGSLPGPHDAQVHHHDLNNPWNVGAVPPAVCLPGQMGYPPVNPMSLPPPGLGIRFPPPNMTNPFNSGFGMPPPTMATIPPPSFPTPFSFPPVDPSSNIMGSRDQNSRSNGNRGHGASGSSPRDFGDSDLRRPYGRERNQDSRRDYDRGRSRDDYRSRDRDRRDRDRRSRSPSPASRRRRDDRDRGSRDNQDYRSRSRPNKKDIPCRYFQKGSCSNGSRCEFSHDVGRSADRPRSETSSVSSASSSRSNHNEHLSPNESWEGDNDNDISKQFERRPSSEIQLIDLADTPSSPTNEGILDPSSLSTKIIPV